jgi:hypothetical protein
MAHMTVTSVATSEKVEKIYYTENKEGAKTFFAVKGTKVTSFMSWSRKSEFEVRRLPGNAKLLKM